MSTEPKSASASPLTWLAFVIAFVMSAASIYLTAGQGLIACPLCYYQRTFALAALGVLGLGIYTAASRAVSLTALVLPLAAAGLGVAGWHVYLEQSGKLECPRGLFALGTVPQQSLGSFVLLTLVLMSEVWQDLKPGGGWPSLAAGLVIGAVFAFACVKSAAPVPLPEKYFEGPPVICRPVRAPVA